MAIPSLQSTSGPTSLKQKLAAMPAWLVAAVPPLPAAAAASPPPLPRIHAATQQQTQYQPKQSYEDPHMYALAEPEQSDLPSSPTVVGSSPPPTIPSKGRPAQVRSSPVPGPSSFTRFSHARPPRAPTRLSYLPLKRTSAPSPAYPSARGPRRAPCATEIRSGPSTLGSRPDAYSLLGDDPDAEWSTLARPKKKPRKDAPGGAARSGPFRLALAHPRFGGARKDHDERGQTVSKKEGKRRVVTFLPPPRVGMNSGGDVRQDLEGRGGDVVEDGEHRSATEWTMRRADVTTCKLTASALALGTAATTEPACAEDHERIRTGVRQSEGTAMEAECDEELEYSIAATKSEYRQVRSQIT